MKIKKNICSIENCKNSNKIIKDLCKYHYERKRKYGDPLEPLRTGRYGKGRTKDADGYMRITINGKIIFEHRHVMELFLERKLFKNEEVHHKNGQKDDNRIENLELWAKSQPAGQRVEDKLEWCIETLKKYGIIDVSTDGFITGYIESKK